MKRRLLTIAICSLALAMPTSGRAAEPFVEFLRALQNGGHGEMALGYIEQIAKRPDLPAELKEVLDLERSKSLRISAGEAYDAAQRTERLAEADKLLAKFLKEHPGHPAGSTALIAQADETLQKAQYSLAMSRATRDKAEAEKFRVQARTEFGEAHKAFTTILATMEDQLKKLPKPPDGAPIPGVQLDLEFSILEGRFKLALADYFTAQTFADPKDATRKKHLQAAGKGFDAIFQRNRSASAGLLRAAFLGHMWHGKVLEELGDEETAMEVYDEVLVVSPEGTNAPIDEAPLFAQAALFRFRLMAKKTPPAEIVREGDEWLKLHKSWEPTSPFQGIAMEVAKAVIAVAEKSTGAEQKKKYRDAVTVLRAIGKTDSEYKGEALLLARELQEKIGKELAATPDEEIALGDSAVAAKEWEEANDHYEAARAMAEKAKNQPLVDKAIEKLTGVRLQLAVVQYGEKKFKESLDAARAIVRDAPKSEAAVSACALAVACALELYSAADEATKPEALKMLENIANYTIENNPDKAEADDARMALARAKLLKGEPDAALELLGDVNPRSKRYGAAQQVAGQLYWKKYVDAKRAKDSALEAQLPMLRSEARKRMIASLAMLKEEEKEKDQLTPTIFDAQLLLAEVSLEDQAPADAAKLFEPLIEHYKKNKPENINDISVLKVFIGSVKSHLASENVAAAGDAAMALIDLSDDDEKVNAILIDFSKLLGMEARKTDADIIRLEGAMPPMPDELKAAIQANAAAKKVLAQMIEKLATREKLALPGLIYLGDTSANLALNAQARNIYDRVMKTIDKGESGADGQKAATRIRSQLISLLRTEGKFEDAQKQVDALIKTHPNALEPLMEKGRILQSWAEKDPKRYDECVSHWTRIRTLLGRLKKKPDEYFEVLYNVAFCLIEQAKATKDPSKALQAEQVLKSSLTLTPDLNGPDMVAKYEALLAKAVKMREKASPAKPPATKKAGTTAATK